MSEIKPLFDDKAAMWAALVLKLDEVINTAMKFIYQGFEPEKFSKSYQITWQKNYIDSLGAKVKPKSNEMKKEFVNDVQVVIGIYCQVGIKVKAKRIAHTTDEALEVLERVKSRFGFELDGPAPNDADTCTIQRIAAVNAHLVAKVYHEKGHDLRIPGGYYDKLPLALHFAMAPSLIPQDAAWDKVFWLWISWGLSFDSVVNQGRSEPRLVLGFANLQRQSGYYDEDYRLRLMTELGIDPNNLDAPQPELHDGLVGRMMKGEIEPTTNTTIRAAKPAGPARAVPQPAAGPGGKPAAVKIRTFG
jgi:hypothetical protein